MRTEQWEKHQPSHVAFYLKPSTALRKQQSLAWPSRLGKADPTYLLSLTWGHFFLLICSPWFLNMAFFFPCNALFLPFSLSPPPSCLDTPGSAKCHFLRENFPCSHPLPTPPKPVPLLHISQHSVLLLPGTNHSLQFKYLVIWFDECLSVLLN